MTRSRIGTEKLEGLLTHRQSDLFTTRERLALTLAERMTYTNRRVTDRFFAQLRKEFSDEELVELAAVIALENFRSKFNPVFGIQSNDFCAVPWVREAVTEATANLS